MPRGLMVKRRGEMDVVEHHGPLMLTMKSPDEPLTLTSSNYYNNNNDDDRKDDIDDEAERFYRPTLNRAGYGNGGACSEASSDSGVSNSPRSSHSDICNLLQLTPEDGSTHPTMYVIQIVYSDV